MGLGNGNSKSGNKGSNFNYEMRHLQILGNLVATVAPPPGGLATEATALNILSAINTSNQDIEVLLVRDNGNGGVVVKQIQELVGGAISYEDVNGAPYVPVGPLVFLDPSAVLNLMLTEMLAQGLTLDDIETAVEDLNTKFNTLGQKASAGSAPVVLSTEQEAIFTAMDTVLDNIKLDTADIVTATEAIETLLTGQSRTPSVTTATVDGSTTAGVKGVSLWFRGNNGTLGGEDVPNGSRFTFTADDNNDTVASIAYEVPTTGAGEIIITYLT